MSARGPGTRAVHGGNGPRRGPLAPPIVQTSTFAFASTAELRRYLDGDPALYAYTRHANPTLDELERALADLEGAEAGLSFASGMAAISSAVMSIVRAGDEVLASAALYGGTLKLLTGLLPRLSVSARLLAPAELPRVDELAAAKSRLLVLESPTNPTLEIVDMGAVCRAAHARGLVVLVDNTFASPILQRPLALGADLVMHSLTKVIAGHSDVMGGALAGPRARIDAARETLRVLGGCLDPHAAFLALRGLRTLHLRVERQCRTALFLARRLEGHPALRRVIYPGLESHPGHAVARRQMAAFGGMLTLELSGGLAAAERFYDRLQLVARAASLGGVESLASLPVHSSHHGLDAEELRAAGVAAGMVRLSIGVEDEADLAADLEQALAA